MALKDRGNPTSHIDASMKFRTIVIFSFIALCAWNVRPAAADSYRLEIKELEVNIGGSAVRKLAINGSIPGPELRFREGEEVVISVTNRLDEDTSIHWHGLLLPGEMDGVPGANGFPGIKPGATFTYSVDQSRILVIPPV